MAETQNSKQNVQAPQAGQTVIVNAIPGQDIVLEAAFDQAEVKLDNGNVVFEFANGGQVVLDFSDLGTAQAPNVVMPDGTILNMEEFLASLGESDDEPAAGPEAGADGSGGVGEYRDDAGNLIDGTDKLNGLDPREFSSVVVPALEADTIDEEGNPVPAAGIVAGAVDEDGLKEGIGDTVALGDHPAQLPIVEGNLSYAFGGDGPAGTDPFVWSLAGLADKGVMSQGNVLQYEVVDGVTLNAFYMGYESDGGGSEQKQDEAGPFGKIIVFTLELTDLDTGAYRFELFRPLDHSDPLSEDDIVYNFTFTITDGSGDTAVGGLNMVVDDDSPIWQSIYASSSALVVEETMAFEDYDNSDGSGGVMSYAALLSSAGEKGQAEIESFLGLESGGLSPLAASGAGFDDATNGSAMKIAIDVTAGDEISFFWSFFTAEQVPAVGVYNDYSFVVIDGQAIELADVSMVGSLGATPWAKFTYTATSTGNITVGFGVMNTGDIYVDSYLKIDNLQLNGQSVDSGRFGDGDLSGWEIEGIVGTVPYTLGDESSGMTGSLAALVAFGADGPGEFFMLEDTSSLPTLFSKDEQVQYVVEGNTLIAYVGEYPSEPEQYEAFKVSVEDEGGYRVVFTLTIDSDGSWYFDLQDQLDHVDDGSNSKNFDLITGEGEEGVTSVPAIDFSSLIKVTDGDGDVLNGAPAGSFTIAIQDDVPVVTVEARGQDTLEGLKVSLDETVGDDRYNPDIPEVSDEVNHDDLLSESDPPKVEALAQVRTSINGGLVGLFTVGGAVGADEPGSEASGVLSFEGFPDVGGLETTLSVTGGGTITLFLVDGVIVGTETDDDGDSIGEPVFTIGIVETPADSGAYQLETTLFRPIDHGADRNHYDTELPLHLAVNGAVQLKYEVTRSDFDGDTVTGSALIDLISRKTEGEGEEQEVVDKSYFSFDDDGPKVDVSSQVAFTLTVTNLDQWSSAGFSNSFGYYIKDDNGEPTLGGKVIWANVKSSQEAIETIQGYTPDQIGFFIIPNGFRVNEGLLFDGLEVKFVEDDGGNWQAMTKVGEHPLTGTNANILFDDATLNQDGISYATNNAVPGNLNWEDILKDSPGFDNDYNDVNINVRWSSNMPALVTQDKEAIGEDDYRTIDIVEGQHAVTGEFAQMFSFSGDSGSDGEASATINYVLAVTHNDSGLFSEGHPIVLSEGPGGVILGDTPNGTVFSISVDSAEGTVTLTQFKQIDHLGEAGDGDASNNSENMAYLLDGRISLTATYTIVDGDGDLASDSQAIDISSVFGFEDDVPQAKNDAVSAMETGIVGKTYNLLLIVDRSGSISKSEMEDAVKAMNSLLDKYAEVAKGGAAGVQVQVVTFAEDATLVHSSPVSIADAKEYLDFLDNSGGSGLTNYDAAVAASTPAINGWPTATAGHDNVVYFLTDGEPTAGNDTVGLTDDEEAVWESTLASRGAIAWAIGIGTNDATNDNLADAAYPNGNVLLASNFNDALLDVLIGTVPVPTTIDGNVLANDVSGADGWNSPALVSASFGVYTHVFTSLTDSHTFDLGLVGSVLMKGDGSYYFTPGADVKDDIFADLSYTVRDGDGDEDTATLRLTTMDSSEVTAVSDTVTVVQGGIPWDGNSAYTDQGSGVQSDYDIQSIPFDVETGNSISLSLEVSEFVNPKESGGQGTDRIIVDIVDEFNEVKAQITLEYDNNAWGVTGGSGSIESSSLDNGIATLNLVITGVTAGDNYRVAIDVNNRTPGNEKLTVNATTLVVGEVSEAFYWPSVGMAAMALPITGNLFANDALGAEGASIMAVTVGVTDFTPNNAGLIVATGQYGTVTVNTLTGAYEYAPNLTGSVPDVDDTDVFTYTLVQPDGDFSKADLTITFADSVGEEGSPNSETLVLSVDTGGVLYGLGGNDHLIGGDGNDSLYGDAGSDVLEGGLGNDLLFGGSGSDFLSGGEDNDTLVGGAGDDVMLGGNGADVFKYQAGDLDGVINGDTILDFELGVDSLNLSELLPSLTSGNLGHYLDIQVNNISGGSASIQINVDTTGSGDFTNPTTLATIQASGFADGTDDAAITAMLISNLNGTGL